MAFRIRGKAKGNFYSCAFLRPPRTLQRQKSSKVLRLRRFLCSGFKHYICKVHLIKTSTYHNFKDMHLMDCNGF